MMKPNRKNLIQNRKADKAKSIQNRIFTLSGSRNNNKYEAIRYLLSVQGGFAAFS